MNKKDLLNQKFGLLTVVAPAESVGGCAMWACRCDCGNEIVCRAHNLLSGNTKSCGCTRSKRPCSKYSTQNGLSRSRQYIIWSNMKRRCYCETDKYYEVYGGKGITICDEWKDNFLSFYEWSLKTGFADGLTIDRIDNSKGYSPDNCRWVSIETQANNRTNNHIVSYHGQSDTLVNMCRELNVNPKTIYGRMKHNRRSFEQAVDDFDTTPPYSDYLKYL